MPTPKNIPSAVLASPPLIPFVNNLSPNTPIFDLKLTNSPSFDASCSDLLRRLNPKHTSEHLNAIISLAPDLTEDLLSSVDQPLTVKRCRQTGRDYLLCDYNRDGDSYRSPWSNQFDPPLDEGGVGGVGPGGSEGAGEGAIPNERVRKMEIKANEAFDIYRELYYEGGVSSVYLWNLDDGFAGVVLVKKCALAASLLLSSYSVVLALLHTHQPGPESHVYQYLMLTNSISFLAATPGTNTEGVWDSIHVFEAIERGRTTHYKLTSTVILSLSTNVEATVGDMDLSGNMTRQVEQDLPVENDDSHIANVGRLVEDMELKMRNLLQDVYFGKAKDVVGDLRSVGSLSDGAKERETQRELIGSMKR